MTTYKELLAEYDDSSVEYKRKCLELAAENGVHSVEDLARDTCFSLVHDALCYAALCTDGTDYSRLRRVILDALDWSEWDGKAPRMPITTRMRETVFRRDGYQCQNCGAIHGLTIDHVIPISKGGPNVLLNLQVLCASCNSSKRDSL